MGIKKFKLKQKALSSAKLKGWIEIGFDLIRIRIETSVRLVDAKIHVFEKELANVYGIKPANSSLMGFPLTPPLINFMIQIMMI